MPSILEKYDNNSQLSILEKYSAQHGDNFEQVGFKKIQPEEQLKPLSVNTDKLSQITKEIQNTTPEEKQSISQWVQANLIKSPIKGLSMLGDLALQALSNNPVPDEFLPSNIIGASIDKARGFDPGSENLQPGAVGKALEFAAAAPTFGVKTLGGIASSGAMGGAEKVAKDLGADTLGSTAAGLAAGFSPSLVSASKNIGKNPIAKSKSKNFNLEAFEAAERQNIEGVPRAALDNSFSTRLAQTVGEHSVLAANKLEKESKKLRLSSKEAVERNLDRTSTPKTLENQELRDQLYSESKGKLTPEDVHVPNQVFDTFDTARKNIVDHGFVSSKKEKEYLELFNKLENAIRDTQKSQILDKSGKSISLSDFKSAQEKGSVAVKKLVDEKERLNKIIGKISPDDWVVKEELKNIRNSLKSEINEYAKSHPEFAEKWNAAEKLHGEMESRVELNKMLGIKEHLHPELSFEPKKLAENYLNVKNDKNFIRLIGGKENLKDFEDIVKVAASLPDTKISTLAKNMKTMAYIYTAANVLTLGGLNKAKNIGMVLGGDALVGRYLTNQNAIKKMAQYARKPTAENAKIMNNTFKKEFGKTVSEANDQLQKLRIDG